jgi:uncharacterized membrane protein YphA (DoxX/SURF4 family)
MTGAIILLLATVFVTAAAAKLRSLDAFRTVLRGLFPRPLVNVLTIVVPAAEFALGIFLLSGAREKVAITVAIVLLGIFTVMLMVMWVRGIKGCACFGEAVNTATTGSGIARNVILIGTASFAWREAGPVVFWGPDVSSVLARLTVVVGSLCLWATFSALVNQRKIYFNDFS